MSVFQFFADSHTYKLDGRPLTGVTTGLRSVAKPNLVPWAAKMAVEAAWEARHKIIDAVPNGPDAVEKAIKSVLKASKSEHNKRRDAGADVGTLAHEICEKYDESEGAFTFEEYDGDKSVWELTENHRKFYDEHVDRTVAVERPLFSEKLWIGGTPDGFYEMKGTTLIVNDLWGNPREYEFQPGSIAIKDNKFKGGIYGREDLAQMRLYVHLLEEMRDMKDIKIEIHWEDGRVENYDSVQEYLGELMGVNVRESIILRQGKPLEDQTDKLYPKGWLCKCKTFVGRGYCSHLRDIGKWAATGKHLYKYDWKEDFEVVVSNNVKQDLNFGLAAFALYRGNKEPTLA